MRSNTATKREAIRTHEGGVAVSITAEQQLRRTVLSCLLWEDEFYEDGQSVADRIVAACALVPAGVIAGLAHEARTKHHLRHVPLFLAAILAGKARGGSMARETIRDIIQRADELAEFVAIYAKLNGVTPDKVKPKLSNQVRKGLAEAFPKFNEYALAKYNRDGAVKLRDVLFLCHAKPRDDEQRAVWEKLIAGTLPPPDTWEVELSAGKDKRATFERLIAEGKLGYLALLRNLRNMDKAGVDQKIVRKAIVARKGADRVLPFRYVAAARACPVYEPDLDKALCATIAGMKPLPGKTVVLVDVSSSMDAPLSKRSDLSRMDAAATLASMINAEELRVFVFSEKVVEVPPRRGMAGVDVVRNTLIHGGTWLVDAVRHINQNVSYDRLIVLTDEQTAGGMSTAARYYQMDGKLPNPVGGRGYMVNVASAQNGVGYGAWTHLDGFSEHILRWIAEHEAG